MNGENELNDLLKLVVENIDMEHCKTVDERYMASLRYDYVDRPPLVIQANFGLDMIKLPPPWDKFRIYDYSETFVNPVAMMQNQILNFVIPGLIIKDDNPIAIRNNHGTIQIASLLGAKWMLYKNDNPWVEHFDSIDRIANIVDDKREMDINGGILAQSFDTLRFYRDKLNEFPPCPDVIQISIPDLEGPVNTANQLWGSDMFYAFHDEPELLRGLFDKIVDMMLFACREFRKYSMDRLEPFFNTQHFYQFPGRLLIRDDSSIMVSPELYEEFIMPCDARLLNEVGGGSIHFCGNGQHLIKKMLEIPHLKGFDFGQPEYMDIPYIYSICSENKIAITHLLPTREDLVKGNAIRDFPTGIVFVYYTSDLDDALEVVKAYCSSGRI